MIETNAEKSVENKIRHFKGKADHNKNEALRGFKFVMFSTVAVPLLIAFGADDIWSKYIPASLSSLGAFVTAWLQSRKPNQLWTLYRTAERQLESELELYQYGVGDYKNTDTRESLLIEKTNQIYISVNSNWSKLVPDVKELQKEGSK
ncbi:DUF4231 domain-containing protein [Vibrio alginolyticus]|uniref:DUF4231 domain-containing protein n=1 Tax=Vibrio alginolyticus TaxID=663 RepID=UPI0006A7AEFA|nr:DUF4231 domain-containing protein [Vibrio alginolyticus]